MKRDWDLIREVLLEVEAIDPSKFEDRRYGPLRQSENAFKDEQAYSLWQAGFIQGVEASSIDQGDSVIAQRLTWQGHELLDTLRSKPVWEKVKTTAKEKGVELTFSAVVALGKAVIESMLK